MQLYEYGDIRFCGKVRGVIDITRGGDTTDETSRLLAKMLNGGPRDDTMRINYGAGIRRRLGI